MSHLAPLFISSSQNSFTFFYIKSTCPQLHDVAATLHSMHPVLYTVYIQSTCILRYILTCDLVNCRATDAVLFESLPEYINATFYTKGQNMKISPSYCLVFRAVWTFRLPRTITAPVSLLFNILKSTGHVMHHQFNNQNCTLCPRCIYVFCIYLRTNSDLC
jgi:hypothetical protein